MDRWTRYERRVAVVLDLRSSHGQVAGDLLKRRALHRRHWSRVDARAGNRRGNAVKASSEYELAMAQREISHWLARIGSVETKWSSAWPEARKGGRRKVREEKGTKE